LELGGFEGLVGHGGELVLVDLCAAGDDRAAVVFAEQVLDCGDDAGAFLGVDFVEAVEEEKEAASFESALDEGLGFRKTMAVEGRGKLLFESRGGVVETAEFD